MQALVPKAIPNVNVCSDVNPTANVEENNNDSGFYFSY